MRILDGNFFLDEFLVRLFLDRKTGRIQFELGDSAIHGFLL